VILFKADCLDLLPEKKSDLQSCLTFIKSTPRMSGAAGFNQDEAGAYLIMIARAETA